MRYLSLRASEATRSNPCVLAKIAWIASVASSLAMTAVPAFASPATNLSTLLKSFTTYTANFNQVTLDANNRVSQTNSGRVMIKRPGKVRWESNKPTKQVLIANGKTLWIYDIDLQQATKQAISSKFAVTPASLLSGSLTQLDTMFTIEENNNVNQNKFILKAKAKSPSFKSITLIFKNKQMRQMDMINNLDQKTTFKFTNIKLNASLPDSLFKFKAPKGVDVINN